MSLVELKELAKPYLMKAETNKKSLVILIHGFGASTTETRPLGKYLQKKGFDVYGVLLAGHGTISKELDRVKWEDWVRNIEEAYDKHREGYNYIFIGGVSLGGALALYMSTKKKFDGVFTINALYKFSVVERIFIALLSPWKYHKPRSAQRIKWYKDHGLFAYPDDSIKGAKEANKLLKKLRKEIKKIKIPTLVIQSKADKTISPKSGQWIYSDLKTEKELLELPTGDHILTVDPIREKAFKKIGEFLEKIIKKKE